MKIQDTMALVKRSLCSSFSRGKPRNFGLKPRLQSPGSIRYFTSFNTRYAKFCTALAGMRQCVGRPAGSQVCFQFVSRWLLRHVCTHFACLRQRRICFQTDTILFSQVVRAGWNTDSSFFQRKNRCQYLHQSLRTSTSCHADSVS